MRLAALVTLVMVAFAANSILNRMALAAGAIDPLAFAALRLAAGAAALALVELVRRRGLRFLAAGSVTGTAALLVYVLGFSLAYLSLDAGAGALILFGAVQVTMMLGAALAGDALTARRLTGALVAFAGLAWLMWPAPGSPVSPPHAALMAAAGIGWGVYSMAGRRVADPLAATAANFVFAVPVGLALPFAVAAGGWHVTPQGAALAVLSGAVTSGLGYALWYAVLPGLGAVRASVVQLTVPVIAVAGGVVFLGETVSLTLLLAGGVVLGGVAWALTGR